MYCKHCGHRNSEGSSYCKSCGRYIRQVPAAGNEHHPEHHSTVKKGNRYFKVAIWVLVLSFGLGAILAFFSSGTSTENITATISPTEKLITINSQEEIASAVVNIFCPSKNGRDDSSGGSGLILTEEGIILTNSHIIPQTSRGMNVAEEGCLVVLPDPVSGQPSEFYVADPIVIPSISSDYDLAYLKIYDAYFDTEKKEYVGTYPRKFPAFNDTTRCSNEDIKLGEPVRVFGYPAISGGYSLTITDGIVSSLPGDGTIFTSAKISSGNSGGLAVDKDGCMLGVPSMVSSDDAESLGIIYSMDLVHEFESEVNNLLEKNKGISRGLNSQ